MSRLSVLCTTMHQTDFSKFHEMNIRSDAIFANQCDRNEVTETNIDGFRVKMISTNTVGVGLNRNISFLASDTEIVLFADDDVRYNDDYVEQVLKAFEDLPKAEMIAFGIDITKDGKVVEPHRNPTARTHIWNCLKYGACVLAVRASALRRENILFTTLFGGGCIYGSGEDSMFVLDCVRSGMKVYSHSYVLGQCSQDSSTWFTGFHEKYFYDKGAWVAAAFPRLGFLLRHYFALHFCKSTELSYRQCCRLMKMGQKGFAKLLTWQNTR